MNQKEILDRFWRKPDKDPDLISHVELADHTDRSVATVFSWQYRNTMPYPVECRYRRAYYFRKKDVERIQLPPITLGRASHEARKRRLAGKGR